MNTNPQAIREEEWQEIVSVSFIRDAWGVSPSDVASFAQTVYGARFQYESGSPGYSGDLFVLYGDALSGYPVVLIRDAAGRLEVVPPEFGAVS